MALDISYHNLACVAGAKRGGGGGRKKGKREGGTSLSAKRALTADACSGFKTVSLPLDKFTSLKALSTTSTSTAAISTVC